MIGKPKCGRVGGVCKQIAGVTRLDVLKMRLRERLTLEPILKKLERRECWKEKVKSRMVSVVE